VKNYFIFILSIGLIESLFSCFPARVFRYGVADIKDGEKFDAITINNDSTQQFHFFETTNTNRFHPPSYLKNNSFEAFDKFTSKGKTVAFLVIKNDTIIYENYSKKYHKNRLIPSFSVSKSFVSALIGIALEEGYINNIDEPITNYLPELKDEQLKEITIRNVLDMRADFKFGENYFNPFSEVAKYYYGRDLKKFITKLKAKGSPGNEFKYQSVNTQVLAFILENATQKAIHQYLEEKLWKPMHMEAAGSWNVDDKGNIKAFCCVNAIARDFAKLGKLYNQHGNWEGQQLIPKNWVDSTLYFNKELNDFVYSNHWWHTVNELPYSDSALVHIMKNKQPYKFKTNHKGNPKAIIFPSGDSFARGVLGQHIYINPEKNIIIVRMGKGFGFTKWRKMFRTIAREN